MYVVFVDMENVVFVVMETIDKIYLSDFPPRFHLVKTEITQRKSELFSVRKIHAP